MGAVQPVKRLDGVAAVLMTGKQAVAVVVLIYQHNAFICLKMLHFGIGEPLTRRADPRHAGS